MLEHGSYNSLPAKYRIALALSSAFLIHTLLLSGVPSALPDPPARHQQQLNLELISAKSPSGAPALSASPYPPPSPEQSGKNRFEVKLVFSPSRL